MADNSTGKKYGYGKRPMWHWVVLYLIVGLIVYAAIYWFFIRKGGGDGAIYSY